jgi:thiol-disulfide isomerase/thioredoxin
MDIINHFVKMLTNLITFVLPTTSLFLIIGITVNVNAQERDKNNIKITEETLVGTKLPNHTLPRVRGYITEYGEYAVPLNDFNGKWIILYFWTKNCTPCIKSFPKLKEIREQNGDDLQVLLVGINDTYNQNIEDFYDGVRAVQKFSLPIAFDTVLVRKLHIIYSGTAVLVNPDGTIEYVCPGSQLSSKLIKSIIRRRPKSKRNAA